MGMILHTIVVHDSGVVVAGEGGGGGIFVPLGHVYLIKFSYLT